MNRYPMTNPVLRTNAHILNHMVEALLLGFQISEGLQQVIRQDQGCNSLDEAVKQWLMTLLILPDRHLGELLMPVVTQRFHEYLHNLERHSPWVH